MKKASVILLVIILLFSISGCKYNYNYEWFKIQKQAQSENKTMDKVDGFVNKIVALAEEHNYTVKFDDSYIMDSGLWEPVYGSSERDFTIEIDDNQYIEVYFKNSGYKKDKGKSRFSIDYFVMDKNKWDQKLDLDFFVGIVNIVSKKEITKEECIEFLETDKYAEYFDEYESNNDESLKEQGPYKKEKIYNFWEDWIMNFHYYSDVAFEYGFGGLTK